MSEDFDQASYNRRYGPVRAPQSLIAGLAFIVLAALGLWLGSDLSTGSLGSMGPGMLPRWLAIAVGLCGIGLVGLAFWKDGEPLERWSLRGPVFVIAGILAFALTIRTVGLAVAGPLAMLISGAATPEVRPLELVIFTAIMTAFCIGLFRYVLGLPIPILILPGLYI